MSTNRPNPFEAGGEWLKCALLGLSSWPVGYLLKIVPVAAYDVAEIRDPRRARVEAQAAAAAAEGSPPRAAAGGSAKKGGKKTN